MYLRCRHTLPYLHHLLYWWEVDRLRTEYGIFKFFQFWILRKSLWLSQSLRHLPTTSQVMLILLSGVPCFTFSRNTLMQFRILGSLFSEQPPLSYQPWPHWDPWLVWASSWVWRLQPLLCDTLPLLVSWYLLHLCPFPPKPLWEWDRQVQLPLLLIAKQHLLLSRRVSFGRFTF